MGVAHADGGGDALGLEGGVHGLGLARGHDLVLVALLFLFVSRDQSTRQVRSSRIARSDGDNSRITERRLL